MCNVDLWPAPKPTLLPSPPSVYIRHGTTLCVGVSPTPAVVVRCNHHGQCHGEKDKITQPLRQNPHPHNFDILNERLHDIDTHTRSI